MPDITVVVPTMAAVRAEPLVRSLAAQSVPHEAILVDNAAPDGERMAGLRSKHPSLDVIPLGDNAGFSRAANLAAGRAAGEILVFVNDDCVLEPAFLARLASALDAARGVTMAAGVMRDARRPDLIDTAGIQLDATLFAFDYLNGEPLARLEGAPPPFGPSAAAAAIARDAFWEVGGFDEALFAYQEDVDLAIRLRLAGGACALASGAIGSHEHSATTVAGSPRKDYLMGFGRGYLLRKWSVATPRRVPGILLREGVICLGQAVLDRNLGGVKGRLRGFAAAAQRRPYPADVIEFGRADNVFRALWHHARRRLRLRRPARRSRSR